jgi:Arc/MetJ-type ribon-helix-helix transcriptional regulator
MSIVNFSIPSKLEKRVNSRIKEGGFAGKAEFFRMAAMFFLDSTSSQLDESKRTEILLEAIKEEVVHKYGKKKLPSVRKQLADL